MVFYLSKLLYCTSNVQILPAVKKSTLIKIPGKEKLCGTFIKMSFLFTEQNIFRVTLNIFHFLANNDDFQSKILNNVGRQFELHKIVCSTNTVWNNLTSTSVFLIYFNAENLQFTWSNRTEILYMSVSIILFFFYPHETPVSLMLIHVNWNLSSLRWEISTLVKLILLLYSTNWGLPSDTHEAQ